LALLGLLLALSGCALLAKDPSESPKAELATYEEQRPGGEPPAPLPSSDGLVIDAPSELRTLLLRNLDLARLVSLTGAEGPDETEWLRLIAAAPAQVRELLETEGYFHPEVQVQRDRGPPPVVHVRVVPGSRAKIQEVALSVRGVLRESADAGDAAARDRSRRCTPVAAAAG
jgi:translocation and assembly module TamA